MLYFLFPQLRDAGPLVKYLIAFQILFGRYFIVAGIFFLLFYIIKRQTWLHLKIQQKYPESRRIWQEVKYSLLSLAIISAMITVMGILGKLGYTRIYTDVADRGWLYFVGSLLFVIFFHDTYFYWTHRLMHHPKLFRHAHKVHHLSHNPTPWAAYSFHPIEAVIEFAFVPVLIMAVPLHFGVMAIFGIYMISMNVLGHLGFETFGKGFVKHPVGKWHNTSTHHNMHHKLVNCNYGLYFNIWDRLMGTNHAKYEQTYEEVTNRPKLVVEPDAVQQLSAE